MALPISQIEQIKAKILSCSNRFERQIEQHRRPFDFMEDGWEKTFLSGKIVAIEDDKNFFNALFDEELKKEGE